MSKKTVTIKVIRGSVIWCPVYFLCVPCRCSFRTVNRPEWQSDSVVNAIQETRLLCNKANIFDFVVHNWATSTHRTEICFFRPASLMQLIVFAEHTGGITKLTMYVMKNNTSKKLVGDIPHSFHKLRHQPRFRRES